MGIRIKTLEVQMPDSSYDCCEDCSVGDFFCTAVLVADFPFVT